jgi:hypothetical protein
LSNGRITNSYATGAVSDEDNSYTGGFVGYDAGRGRNFIGDSYSTGFVGSGTDVGGFAAFVANTGVANDDYWDTTTSGTDTGVGEGNPTGIAGLTTEQLQSGLPTGFDPNIWAENPTINNGFPYLIANLPPK